MNIRKHLFVKRTLHQ